MGLQRNIDLQRNLAHKPTLAQKEILAYKEILIVAGEASADRYGARLVRKLSSIGGEDLRFFGTGGDEMQRAGVRLISHVRDLATIGPREVLAHLQKYYQTFQELIRESRERRPAVAVLMDFPDFNLRLAKRLKRAGIPVVYYISPQLWGWRHGRIKLVQKYVDKMLVILPFEEEYYRQRGVAAEFVGHPLLEDFAPQFDRVAFLRRWNLVPERKTIAILSGSRRKEVEYILPTLLQAGLLVLEHLPAQFVISAAPTVGVDTVGRIASSILRGHKHEGSFRIVAADSRDILANADFGFVKSGTSTLEAALVGTPFLIVYKISPVSWHLANPLITVPFRGLVNLIAGEEVAPEFLQKKATPEAISRTAIEYLEEPEKGEAMKARLAGIRQMLSARCATDTVAQVLRGYL
jgi:lipid-A-disaccharide synthase